MSTGQGIFWGFVFCGLIYLFTQTKELWNWRKIWKKIGITVGLLFLGIVLILEGSDRYDDYQRRPKYVDSIGDVKIGQSYADSVFLLEDLKKIKSRDNEQDSLYPNDGTYEFLAGRGWLQIRNNRVILAEIRCNKSGGPYLSLNIVSCDYTSEEVLKRYGKDVEVYCLPIQESGKGDERYKYRVYLSNKHGARYLLANNKVIALAVFDPKGNMAELMRLTKCSQ